MAETKVEQRVRELELELDAESHENEYLQKQVEDIGDSLCAVETRLSESDILQSRHRVQLEHSIERVEKLIDSQRASDKLIDALSTDIAVLRHRVDENCRQTEKLDARVWWFFTAIVGMLFATIVGLIVALVKR